MRRLHLVLLSVCGAFLTLLSVGGGLLAVHFRSDLGWLGVAGVWLMALCAILLPPTLAATNTSGKWYTLSVAQPELEAADNYIRWETTPRNHLFPFLLVVPLFIGATVAAYSGLLSSHPRGALMPIYGTATLIGAIGFSLALVSQQTTVELCGKQLTCRLQEFPFLTCRKRVENIRQMYFWERTDPLPSGCRLLLRGDVETEWQWRGKTFHRSQTQETTIAVPYFRNATPAKISELVQACQSEG